MKEYLQNTGSNIFGVSPGEISSVEISPENQAKMQRILRDTLYSDKILAIVREYGTNAFDAHVFSKKKDVPFNVSLPTIFDPFFKVRDFGPGLDEDSVRNIFAAYCNSTKDKSNLYNGQLGIGSKCAFAYHTRTFVVISHYNKKKTTYSLFLDDAGLGKCARLGDEETNETGLEIIVPVNDVDVGRFRARAESVYSYFSTRPNVTPSISWHDFGKKLCDSFFDVGVKDWDSILMGNVRYKLSEEATKELPYFPVGYLLEVPIGTIDFTSNREMVDFTPRTKQNLTKILLRVKEDIKIAAQTEIDNAALADVYLVYHKYAPFKNELYKNGAKILPLNNYLFFVRELKLTNDCFRAPIYIKTPKLKHIRARLEEFGELVSKGRYADNPAVFEGNSIGDLSAMIEVEAQKAIQLKKFNDEELKSYRLFVDCVIASLPSRVKFLADAKIDIVNTPKPKKKRRVVLIVPDHKTVYEQSYSPLLDFTGCKYFITKNRDNIVWNGHQFGSIFAFFDIVTLLTSKKIIDGGVVCCSSGDAVFFRDKYNLKNLGEILQQDEIKEQIKKMYVEVDHYIGPGSESIIYALETLWADFCEDHRDEIERYKFTLQNRHVLSKINWVNPDRSEILCKINNLRCPFISLAKEGMDVRKILTKIQKRFILTPVQTTT